MITINFYEDGAYVKGHDIQEVCSVVSYAMWCCINDCLDANENMTYYESANDEQWKGLGFSFIKIDTGDKNHMKTLNVFKERLSFWLEVIHHNRVKIICNDGLFIEWDEALKDVKTERGIA